MRNAAAQRALATTAAKSYSKSTLFAVACFSVRFINVGCGRPCSCVVRRLRDVQDGACGNGRDLGCSLVSSRSLLKRRR